MIKLSKFDNFLSDINEILNDYDIKSTGKDYPAKDIAETSLSESQKKEIVSLMRVNHSGEVAAQGLYIGHSIFEKNKENRKSLLHTASEEKNHLEWCERRISELDGNTSILNPIWCLGSVAIGIISSKGKYHRSLGFIEETEKQVSEHLDNHLKKIPVEDKKTITILEKMKSEEEMHGLKANEQGAQEVSKQTKKIMELVSEIMKKTSYLI